MLECLLILKLFLKCFSSPHFRGKEETDNAEEEFNPLYSSLPAMRPAQPPDYKQAPAYPANVRPPTAELDSRYSSPPLADNRQAYMQHSYSKESFPRVSTCNHLQLNSTPQPQLLDHACIIPLSPSPSSHPNLLQTDILNNQAIMTLLQIMVNLCDPFPNLIHHSGFLVSI